MQIIRNVSPFLAAALLSLGVAISASANHHKGADAKSMDHGNSIIAVATDAGQFKTLLIALDAASLTEVLEGEGPFTVFAPTDAAFAALPAGALDGLLADPEALAKVLTLHVVSGAARAADVVTLTEVTTVEGSALSIDTSDGVSVGGAKVVAADVEAGNGVIHVIDRVILPQS